MKRLWMVLLLLYGRSLAEDNQMQQTGPAAVVQAIFRYEDVPPGRIRPLNRETLQRFGSLFTVDLQKKLQAVVQADQAIPRASINRRYNSAARNEADMWTLQGDPLTNRFIKPDKVSVGRPKMEDNKVRVRVDDTFRENGKIVAKKSADVWLVNREEGWQITDIEFTTKSFTVKKTKKVRLSVALEDLIDRLVKLRKLPAHVEQNPPAPPEPIQSR